MNININFILTNTAAVICPNTFTHSFLRAPLHESFRTTPWCERRRRAAAEDSGTRAIAGVRKCVIYGVREGVPKGFRRGVRQYFLDTYTI